MGAPFDFKCAYEKTLVYVCHPDAEKCIFVWTVLSQTPLPTPQVMYYTGQIFFTVFKEQRMLRKRDYQGTCRLSFHFFES